MNELSSFRKRTYFVDLFVRVSNKRAVDMYHKLNYVVYRRIIGYYSGERDEDAFGSLIEYFLKISFVFFLLSCLDMRKALSRDVEKKSLIPIPHPVRPEDLVDD